MKRYLKMLPVMIYPYFYIISLILTGIIFKDNYEYVSLILLAIAVIYNLYCIVVSIINVVETSKGKYSSKQAANMNLIIKCFHIPGYIIHFLMFLFGALMSVWGIGFIIWAVIIDLISIILSGVNAIGTNIRLSKDGYLMRGISIFMGFLNFIYCIDLVVAIIYFIMTRKNKKDVSE